MSSDIFYSQGADHYRNGNPDMAISVLEKGLDCSEHSNKCLDLWIHILNEANSLEYAVEKLQKLVVSFPKSVEFWFGLASVLYKIGHYSEAKKSYSVLQELAPDNFLIANATAKNHLVLGELDEAQRVARKSVSLYPYNPDSLRIISSEHKYVYGDQDFASLNTASARMSSFSIRDQIQLHYALAKAYFDVDESQTAFAQISEAGSKHLSLKSFDRDLIQKINTNLKRCVTNKNIELSNEIGSLSKIPIMIVGMPRSGTTLLEQILGSHPAIYGAGELLFLGRVVEGMRCGNFQLSIGQPDPLFSKESGASWSQRGDAFVEYLRSLAPPDVQYVIDKMPSNYHYVGMLRALLPNATQIHMLRHPMEVCFSCYKTLFTEGHEWSFRLEDLAFQYRKYWEIMKHWNNEFPGLLFEVYYENLIADPEFEARRILDRLGLPWDSKCLEFYKSDRPVKTASVAQVRKPIYQTSANRWKRYEKYLSPLAEQLSDIIAEYETMLQNSRNNA